MKKNLLYIGNKLSSNGNNVTTIETLGKLLTSEGYQVAYASEKQKPFFRLLDMLWKTFQFRKKAEYVLIDTYSTSGFWFAFLVSQLCRILQLKYIPILHGGNLPVRLKKNPLLSQMVFKHAYKNVAPSAYLEHEFKQAGYANLCFIPNTLEIEKYPFLERKTIRGQLLWVRAFSRIYNPKMAVAVLQKLKESYPDAELCMVGPDKDGSGIEVEKYAAALGIKVTFTGRLDKTDWIALSTDYDVFINTTHLDNTPVSVMEAMALGLPVVSTNVGGIPYLVEADKEALLVADNDVIGMVKAIERLLSDSVLVNELSMKGRSKAEKWDWDFVKKEWHNLLQ